MKNMTSYHKSSGSSLLVVVSTMSILIGVVAIVAHYTTTVSRSVQRTNTMEQALTAADATIETLFTNWRAICRVQLQPHRCPPVPSSGLFRSRPRRNSQHFRARRTLLRRERATQPMMSDRFGLHDFECQSRGS